MNSDLSRDTAAFTRLEQTHPQLGNTRDLPSRQLVTVTGSYRVHLLIHCQKVNQWVVGTATVEELY